MAPWTAAHLHYLPEFAQTHAHSVKDGIQRSHPLSSPSPPALSLSQHQGLFQWVSSLIRWPNYWSFSFSTSSSNECSVLISLGLTGLISLLSKGLSRILSSTTTQKHQFFLQCSVFFIIQLLHLCMTTGKTIALTIQTFVSKVISLLFNMLSRLPC